MKSKQLKKTKTTSFRFDQDLSIGIKKWLRQNPDFNVSKLINMAVRKMITKNQILPSIRTIKAEDKNVEKITKKMIKKHSDMLEKLK